MESSRISQINVKMQAEILPRKMLSPSISKLDMDREMSGHLLSNGIEIDS